MTRRRVCVLIHRVNGLLLAGFLTVAGATGAALAWRVPLERVFAPELFRVDAHTSDAPRVDPLAVRHRVELAFPWAYVEVADLSALPNMPLEFSLVAKQPGKAGKFDDDAFADPYSGRVLGSRRYGDIAQGRRNFIPFVYQLHQELALGDFGTICLGLAALLWTADCFIGMYLSFPASTRKTGLAWSKRLTRWPRRFSPALKVRWRSGSYRRLYDLHRAPGVWLWAMLLLFAWSGVAFNLRAVYATAMRAFGGVPYSPNLPGTCADSKLPKEDPEWPTNLAVARELMHSESLNRHFSIDAERFLAYSRDNCQWTYRVHSSLDVNTIGNTQLIWQNGRAASLAFSVPTGQTKADTFTSWIEAIHEAQVGGSALRLLVCLSGITTAVLAITGVLIFRRKMRRVGPHASIAK